MPRPAGTVTEPRNEVLLRGVLETAPDERPFADGTVAVTFRLGVPRDEGVGRDSIDCSSTAPAVRRRARGWAAGEALEVSGALRKRFSRTGAGSRGFTVVDVERARRA